MQEFIKAHLSKHQYPRQIEFVNKLPKTPDDKIERKELKAREYERAKSQQRCDYEFLRLDTKFPFLFFNNHLNGFFRAYESANTASSTDVVIYLDRVLFFFTPGYSQVGTKVLTKNTSNTLFGVKSG